MPLHSSGAVSPRRRTTASLRRAPACEAPLRIGHFLLDQGLISADDLEEALQLMRTVNEAPHADDPSGELDGTHLRIGDALVEVGAITATEMDRQAGRFDSYRLRLGH